MTRFPDITKLNPANIPTYLNSAKNLFVEDSTFDNLVDKYGKEKLSTLLNTIKANGLESFDLSKDMLSVEVLSEYLDDRGYFSTDQFLSVLNKGNFSDLGDIESFIGQFTDGFNVSSLKNIFSGSFSFGPNLGSLREISEKIGDLPPQLSKLGTIFDGFNSEVSSTKGTLETKLNNVESSVSSILSDNFLQGTTRESAKNALSQAIGIARSDLSDFNIDNIKDIAERRIARSGNHYTDPKTADGDYEAGLLTKIVENMKEKLSERIDEIKRQAENLQLEMDKAEIFSGKNLTESGFAGRPIASTSSVKDECQRWQEQRNAVLKRQAADGSYGGGGGFNTNGVPTIVGGAVGASSQVIREFEGYRSTAYYDVDAWRVGYGSSTVTREDGTVVRVTRDTVVNRADAERDLKRRIREEFLPSARQAVGSDVFDNLKPGQQAVLVSLAYNYGPNAWTGSLSGVASSVRSGNTNEAARAINRLGADNGGIRANRRGREAALFSSGGDIVTDQKSYSNRPDDGFRGGNSNYDNIDANIPSSHPDPLSWSNLSFVESNVLNMSVVTKDGLKKVGTDIDIGIPPSAGYYRTDIKVFGLLNEIGKDLGVTLQINSAYRPPQYNSIIGGAKGSYHKRGLAADVHMGNVGSVQEFYDLARAYGFTGFGFYTGSFVHVDFGPSRVFRGQPWS